MENNIYYNIENLEKSENEKSYKEVIEYYSLGNIHYFTELTYEMRQAINYRMFGFSPDCDIDVITETIKSYKAERIFKVSRTDDYTFGNGYEYIIRAVNEYHVELLACFCGDFCKEFIEIEELKGINECGIIMENILE